MSDSLTSVTRIHLAASTEAEPTAELIKAVAAAAGMTAFDVRLRLHQGLPRSLLCCESIDAAETKAAALNQLGVITIVYEQNKLPPVPPIAATGLGRLQTGLRVRERQNSFEIPQEEFALFVHGVSRLSREKQELVLPKFNVPRVALGMGVPMITGATHRSKHETDFQHFLMVFRRDPLAPAIAIGEDHFDFSCLGEKRGLTKQKSLEMLFSGLHKAFPQVSFNDWLLQGQSNNRGEAYYNHRYTSDSSAANATLIYWRMLALGNGRHFTGPSSTA